MPPEGVADASCGKSSIKLQGAFGNNLIELPDFLQVAPFSQSLQERFCQVLTLGVGMDLSNQLIGNQWGDFHRSIIRWTIVFFWAFDECRNVRGIEPVSAFPDSAHTADPAGHRKRVSRI